MSSTRETKEAEKQKEKALAQLASRFAALSTAEADGLAKKGIDGAEIKRLGGNFIPVYRVTSSDNPNASMILRSLPKEDGFDFIKIVSALRKDKVASAYVSKSHLPTLPDHGDYYLELSEDCSRGDLENVAVRAKKEAIASSDWESVAQSALKYSKNILEMMAEFERREICFPDVKPGNFMLADDGRVMLSDCKTLLSTAGKEKIRLAFVNDTEAYRSPECFAAHETVRFFTPAQLYLENRYKIGLALYEIATGDRIALDLQYLKQDEGVKHEHAIDTNHPVFKAEAGKQILPAIVELMNSYLYERVNTPNQPLQSFADNMKVESPKKQASASSSASLLSAFKQQKPEKDLKPITEAHAASKSETIKKPKNALVRTFSQLLSRDKIAAPNSTEPVSGPTKKR